MTLRPLRPTGCCSSSTSAASFRYDLRYTATLGHANFDASNPNGATKLFTATAYPWPEISDNLYTLRARLTYEVTKALPVGVRYWYENFQLADFMTDIMVPYMFERVPQDLARDGEEPQKRQAFDT